MTVNNLLSANDFSLQFFEGETFVMDGLKCNSFQEFYESIKKGFCYGSQFIIKVKIGDNIIDYKSLKNIVQEYEKLSSSLE